MKNIVKYIAIVTLGFVACEPEFENPIEESEPKSSGAADFSKYVAIGNSLTAGYADNALYIDGQENSFPNIMATQMERAGGGMFVQPLMNDNLGGLLVGGTVAGSNRLVLELGASTCPVDVDAAGNPIIGPTPIALEGTPTTEATTVLSGSFNNFGVPGAKSFHLGFAGYGALNPYFGRFASEPNATIIGDAVAQNPTFFSLWIGSNDVLSFATSGGVGLDQTGNFDPSSYGNTDITDPTVFAGTYSGLVDTLTANGANGVLINLPDVPSIPFFTTVPNNALVLDATLAANLTGFFQAYASLIAGGAIQAGASPQQAQALGAQYAITFNPGPNRFLIAVEPTLTNPQGFRQMTEEELLLLTIDSCALKTQGYGSVAVSNDVLAVLGKLQQGIAPTPTDIQTVLGAVNPIQDKDALDSSELSAIATAQGLYNQTISDIATAKGLALYDAKSDLRALGESGIQVDGAVVTSTFATGGGFSLDGVHPTPRGHAIIANGILKAINETYGSELITVMPGTYNTITIK